MLGINGNTGFYMTFRNRWTISVQFGPGTYSDRRRADITFTTRDTLGKADNWESASAEVAAWHDDDATSYSWFNFSGGGGGAPAKVSGWCPADKVGEFIALVRSLPSRRLQDSDYDWISWLERNREYSHVSFGGTEGFMHLD